MLCSAFMFFFRRLGCSLRRMGLEMIPWDLFHTICYLCATTVLAGLQHCESSHGMSLRYVNVYTRSALAFCSFEFLKAETDTYGLNNFKGCDRCYWVEAEQPSWHRIGDEKRQRIDSGLWVGR